LFDSAAVTAKTKRRSAEVTIDFIKSEPTESIAKALVNF
jgi:hypothetical protein